MCIDIFGSICSIFMKQRDKISLSRTFIARNKLFHFWTAISACTTDPDDRKSVRDALLITRNRFLKLPFLSENKLTNTCIV
jgi:hypothetical protein